MRNVVLKNWAQEWLNFKKDYVKESTYANYLILLKNQILPILGEYPMDAIDTCLVQNTVTYWLDKGRLDGRGGLSQKTVRDMVTLLRMCLHDYSKTYNCSMPSLDIQYPVKRKSGRKRVLTKEQQGYLLQVIRRKLNNESLGYALTLYTGIRIGELCALKWADVDMHRRTIMISKTLQRIYLKDQEGRNGQTKITITSPKSEKAIREIPVSNGLYELLDRMHCRDKNTYLITGTRKYIEPRLYRKHYELFLYENQAEYIRFHGLRHTFATRCVESGADYKVVSELLGHASVTLTMNLYVHPQWEDKKRCVELI